jgi:His/Glu/Gln/Arg/opine family amino acid ABC transporter permease subunit
MLDLALMQQALPKLLEGLHLTVLLTLAVLAVGLVLALPLALAHRSRHRWLRLPAEGYILLFRGTPALVQVFLLYYGAGQFEAVRESALWPILREPFWCFVIALGLNSTAYVGQLLSGALRNLPQGVQEAAQALGLSRWQALWTVRLPLVVRQIVPALGNEAILTLKATSLACTITLLELTGMARNVIASTFAPYEVFLVAGAIYLVLTFALTRAFAAFEARLRIPGA